MKKASETKEAIVVKAAEVFNTKGYAGSSMQDVMERTGLKKGGIYNHFASKEDLSLAAFRYAFGTMHAKYLESFDASEGAINKLLTFIETFRTFIYKPPIKGGCPIMNSSAEVDDTNPRLSAAVREAALVWEQMLEEVIVQGIRNGEIKAGTNANKIAVIIISSLEGGIMLGKLHRNASYMHAVADYLIDLINVQLKN